MDNENVEQETKGITFGDICKAIGRGWLPGVITLLVIVLVGTLGLSLFVNRSEEYYSVQFNYASIPGIKDGDGNYIDGSRYSKNDLLSKEYVMKVMEDNAKEVEAGTAEFDYSKSIDTKKLLSNEVFSIGTKYIYRNDVDTTNDYTVLRVDYVLKLPKKLFSSQELAEAFATDLTSIPLTKTKEMVNNLTFTTNLENYANVLNYSSKLSYLDNQINLIKNGYTTLNGTLDGVTYTINGTTYNFTDRIQKLNDYLESQNYSTMKSELSQNGYVNPEELELAKARYQVSMDDLQKEHDLLQAKYDALEAKYEDVMNKIASGSTLTDNDTVIQLLTQLNNELVNQLNDYKLQILDNEEAQRKLNIYIDAANNGVDSTAYAKRMENIYNYLVSETKVYDVAYKDITNSNMTVYYNDSTVVVEGGGLGTLKTVGIPGAIGLVAGLVVAGVVGYVKKNKKEAEVVEAK